MKPYEEPPLHGSLRRIIRETGGLELPARGTSMYPLIREGDLCRFVPAPEGAAARGDIVLYGSRDGGLIAHRLHFVVRREDVDFYICKGDANLGCDEPICAEQVIGVLDCIRKKRGAIRPIDPSVRLWAAVAGLPFISAVLRRHLARSGRGADKERPYGSLP